MTVSGRPETLVPKTQGAALRADTEETDTRSTVIPGGSRSPPGCESRLLVPRPALASRYGCSGSGVLRKRRATPRIVRAP